MFVGIFGFCILGVVVASEGGGSDEIIQLLSSLGGFLGGAAGIIAATAAYQGINTWKAQLKHGKHISILWSTMESLRAIQSQKIHWYWPAYMAAKNQVKNEDVCTLTKSHLDQLLEQFEGYCSSLDIIVVKNQWEWANHASFLKLNISEIDCTFRDLKEGKLSDSEANEKLIHCNNKFTENCSNLENLLDKIEAKYINI